MACNQCYPINIENTNKKRRLIGYFPIVLMKLFELYMFELDINTRFETHMKQSYVLKRKFIVFR